MSFSCVLQDQFQDALAIVIVGINMAFMLYIATKSSHTRPWIFTPVTKAKSVKHKLVKVGGNHHLLFNIVVTHPVYISH